jgi:hypothetical protein
MFDLFFRPFRALDPLWAVAAFSVVTGVLMVLAFRYASNQRAVRRAKDRLGAHVLEVRLFQDQLGVVVAAYGKILRATGAYIGATLKPLAVMLVPLLILLAQMDLRLGAQPFAAGQPLLLKVRFAAPEALDQAELRLPDGLELTAPALRIPDQREVDWRLQPRRAGAFLVQIAVGSNVYEKQVVVDQALAALPGQRVRGGRFTSLLYPGEARLPSHAPVESITVNYPPREVRIAGWGMHWLIPFFVLSLLVGYAVKGVFRTEF